MRDWRDTIDSHTKAQAQYDKKNTVGVYLKLNIHTDADIIRWFWGQSSKQGAVKKLIREEIARAQAGTNPDTSPADHCCSAAFCFKRTLLLLMRMERSRCQEDRGIMGPSPVMPRKPLDIRFTDYPVPAEKGVLHPFPAFRRGQARAEP